MGFHGRFAATVLLIAGVTPAAHADIFLGTPGLWQNTYKAQPATDADAKKLQPQWHCVDDDRNAWASYTLWASLPGGPVCHMTQLSHTAKTINWTLDCGAQASVSAAMVFDSNRHFTGQAQVQERRHGRLVHYTIQAEGRRQAACTTAAD